LKKSNQDNRIKEYYHSYKEFHEININPFLIHTKEFLSDQRTIPVIKTKTISEENLFIAYCTDLKSEFLINYDKIKKPHECAIKYGFRGYSKGGKNGIFIVRKQDLNLIKAFAPLLIIHKSDIIQDLDCFPEEVENLVKVKVVYHNTKNERLIEVMNKLNLPFIGRLHRGIDDAKNIAELAKVFLIYDKC